MSVIYAMTHFYLYFADSKVIHAGLMCTHLHHTVHTRKHVHALPHRVLHPSQKYKEKVSVCGDPCH